MYYEKCTIINSHTDTLCLISCFYWYCIFHWRRWAIPRASKLNIEKCVQLFPLPVFFSSFHPQFPTTWPLHTETNSYGECRCRYRFKLMHFAPDTDFNYFNWIILSFVLYYFNGVFASTTSDEMACVRKRKHTVSKWEDVCGTRAPTHTHTNVQQKYCRVIVVCDVYKIV